MMGTHDSLGHWGQDKLFAALQLYFWRPKMYSDVIDCIRWYAVCQKDRPPKTPPKVLRWIDKG